MFEPARPPGNELWVVFSNDSTHQEITSILAQMHGQIFANPSEKAVYTVRFSTANTADSLLATIEHLRSSRHLLFAEPAYVLRKPGQTKRDKTL
jgi:hypothetical protein